MINHEFSTTRMDRTLFLSHSSQSISQIRQSVTSTSMLIYNLKRVEANKKFPAGSLKNILFETEYKNIEALQNF